MARENGGKPGTESAVLADHLDGHIKPLSEGCPEERLQVKVCSVKTASDEDDSIGLPQLNNSAFPKGTDVVQGGHLVE